MATISLKGLNKGKVLAALCNASHPQGMGFLHFDPTPMTTKEAESLLKGQTYFDYLKGRVMEVDMSGEELDPYLYDRDNGQGAAQRVIDSLRIDCLFLDFMSRQGNVVTLPNSEETMSRLAKVEMGANDYMAERFYPLIAQAAGRELVAQGVVMMLTLKIHDFVSSGYPPVMSGILHMYIPQLIDALVDDKDVAKEAKRFHQEVMDATRKG